MILLTDSEILAVQVLFSFEEVARQMKTRDESGHAFDLWADPPHEVEIARRVLKRRSRRISRAEAARMDAEIIEGHGGSWVEAFDAGFQAEESKEGA